LKGKSFTSSLTCVITIGGLPIGGLQDLSFTENYNIKQLNTLGRAYSNTFVPGFFSGEVRVKKAFLEEAMISSAILHNLEASVSLSKLSGNPGLSMDTEVQINDLFNYIAPSDFYDDLIFSILFDIDMYNQDRKLVASIQDCILDSRTTSVSISNLIIMEDLIFKYKSIKKAFNS
jgi:hypothetical protein